MIGGFVLLFTILFAINLSVVSSQSNSGYTCPREKEGLPVNGPCGQRCICLDGYLEYCCRQRKNFPSMTRSERLLYVNTIIKASTDRRYRSEYNQLISIHNQLFDRGIHDKQEFLPWHRWYLLQFENLLQKIDCRVTLPYWDWSFFPGAAWRQGEDDIWSKKPWGLGGNGGRGRRGRARCVKSGRFSRKRNWRLTPSAGRQCLRRSFNAKPPDIIAIQLTQRLTPRQFDAFELELRANLHDTVHCRVGGTMCAHNSANAPEFFLHHAFIDKIWADWQEKSVGHLEVYFRDLPRETRLRQAGFHPEDYIDTLNLPHPDINRFNAERICVNYKDPVHPVYDEIMKRLEALSIREIRQIPRRFFRPASSRQLKKLGVKRKERRKARRLFKKIEPKKKIRGNRDLETIIDKWLGFPLARIPFRITSTKDRPSRSSDRRHTRWLAKATNFTRMSSKDTTLRFPNISSIHVSV